VRPSRFLAVTATAVAGAAILLPAVASAGSTQALKVSAPARATLNSQFAIRIALPANGAASAFEASVLADDSAAQVVAGIPGGAGRMLSPAVSKSASRVGFYGGAPAKGTDLMDILVQPTKSGILVVRLALPVAVDAAGKRIPVRFTTTTLRIRVGGSKKVLRPLASAKGHSLKAGSKVRLDVDGNGRVQRADLYQAIAAWDSTAGNGPACGPTGATGDVDGDGCTTVRDLQLLTHSAPKATKAVASRHLTAVGSPTFTATKTWVVNTTDDLVDATPGNKICLTAAGTCSLRAALDESNRRAGNDLITFNIPGGAGQTIQLTSQLTQINSAGGAVMIDGYTQPGSKVNTDPLVSNAIPGVVINGGYANASSKSASLMITSANNIVRGLAFKDAGRAIVIYGTSASYNYLVGNFFGMDASGNFSGNTGYAGVDEDGSSYNTIGTPDLADRNVFAGFFYNVDHVSPGTTYNKEQNNLFGMSPDGTQVRGASCDNVDHNVGPQHNLLGGLGFREGNVISGGGCDAVEYSHGWNQSLPPRQDNSAQYQVDYNTIQGNLIGLAPDGHYDYRYVPAQGRGDENDGSGVNVIDGANYTLVEGNYIAAHVNGVQIFAPYTNHNTVRNNHIGVTPSGAPSYIGFAGVSVRWQSSDNVITGNDIQNTGQNPNQQYNGNTNGGYGCNTNDQNLPLGCSAGVKISETTNKRNLVSRNTFQNIGNGIGVDLAPIGVVNPNDVGDADTGANQMENFPDNLVATTTGVSGNAPANTTVELYSTTVAPTGNGPGEVYLTTVTATARGTFSASVSLAPGTIVTATATDSTNNTSEFGPNAVVPGAAPIVHGVTYDTFWNLDGSQSLYTTPQGTQPTATSILYGPFQSPTNIGDNFGTRLRAILTVPTTGQYTFYIASDDNGALFLSPSTDPALETKIAFQPNWDPPFTYTYDANQTSAPVSLTAGQQVFIEAWAKEAGGGDNLDVAWSGPGIAQQLIGRQYLTATTLGCSGWCPGP
jgi:CSLREA domain-containing protein